MALSVVDLYARILPRTNCKDCGFPTCLAFAGMVVSEKLPLKNCPHIPEEILGPAQAELEEQYRQGKWLKKDMAAEALSVAREKAASTDLGDMARRVGGVLEDGKAKGPFKGQPHIRLPYFNKSLLLTTEKVLADQGEELTRNEQTFVYIHLAAGSHAVPTGNMKMPEGVSQYGVKNRIHAETCGNPAQPGIFRQSYGTCAGLHCLGRHGC